MPTDHRKVPGEPLKLALVIWSLELGGAERVMSTLANAWSHRHEVTLVTLSGEIPDHFALDDGVARRRLLMESSTSLLGVLASNARLVGRLRRVLIELDPDAVISFMDRTNNQVLVASRGLGVPVVVSERVDPRMHEIPRKARILRRLMYPHADAIVVQTEAVRSWAEQLADRDAVWVVPNPVGPCPDCLGGRENTIVGIGRLVPQKGFDVLLRAFARIALAHPAWQLQIAGEGSSRQDLEALAVRLGIDDRVVFAGIVSDPNELLASASLFVLSSRYEGFPNALLEAMACGVAVIAADCPSGPAEILTSGKDGVLVRSEDVDLLSEALDRLMSDGALRRRLGGSARETVERYSLDAVLAQWDSVIATAQRRKHSTRNDR